MKKRIDAHKRILLFAVSCVVPVIVCAAAVAQDVSPGRNASRAVSSPTPRSDETALIFSKYLQEIYTMREALSGRLVSADGVSRMLAIDYLERKAVDAKKSTIGNLVAEKRERLKKANWSGRKPFPDIQEKMKDDPARPYSYKPTTFHVMLAEYESLRLQLRFLKLPYSKREAFRKKEIEASRIAEMQSGNEEQKQSAVQESARMAAARREAEERTRAVRLETDRAIAQERSVMEAVQSRLSDYRTTLAWEREHLSLTEKERLAQLVVLRSKTMTLPPQSPEMDAFYDEMVQVMQGARKNLTASLNAYESIPAAPRYAGNLSALTPIDGSQQLSLAELKKSSGKMAALADQSEAEAAELAWMRLKSSITWSEEINSLRLSVLMKVSRAKQSRLLGINRDGIAQFKREISDIALFGRWSHAGGSKIALERLTTLKDPFIAGGVVSQTLLIILFVAVYLYVLRHGRSFLDRLRNLLKSAVRSVALVRRMQHALDIVEDIFRELILLIAVLLSPYIIGFDAEQRYWSVIFAIAIWYAAYRLIIKVSLRIIDWFVPGDQFGKQPEQSRRLLRTVLYTGRYFLVVNVVLIIAEAILGQGYLYHILSRIAWLGAFLLFALLIRWWRDDISDAYLLIKPSGTLASYVQATRDRWYGFFVAIAAFGVLFIDTLVHASRRFVYSFEHSQRMLAYLFRRRLEKNVLLTEQEVAPARSLPPEAALFFSENPAADPSLQIDFFPQMDRFFEAIEKWKIGGHIGAFAVVGNFGFGKTTWLNEARRRADVAESIFLNINRRTISHQEALNYLADGLGAPAETGRSVDALTGWLRSREKQLIILDDLHFWFLRAIGAFDALRMFNTLVERTGDHVFWLCSFSNYPYQYYSWSSRDNTVFRAIATLSAWPEGTIENLLKTRTAFAGWRLSYDDLLMENEKDYENRAYDADAAKDYNRLIWDLSLGSPRAAIQYWVNSLSVEPDGLARVRFFKRPDESLLEKLNEQDRFVLACIVWHEHVSIPEITAVLRFPSMTCRDAVLRLREMGILRRKEDYYHVTAQWWPEVIRYLKRKHLVPPGSQDGN